MGDKGHTLSASLEMGDKGHTLSALGLDLLMGPPPSSMGLNWRQQKAVIRPSPSSIL